MGFGGSVLISVKGGENVTEVMIMDLCYFLLKTVEKEAKRSIKEIQTPLFTLYQAENFPIAMKRGGLTAYNLKLHLFLVKHFKLDELRVIGINFGVNKDQLNSSDKTTLALHLMEHSARIGSLGDLVTILEEQIPEHKEQLPDKIDIPEKNQQLEQYIKTFQERKYTSLKTNFVSTIQKWMLEKNLRNSQPGAEIRDIARHETLEVLKELNEVGKSEIVGLLYQYKLIGENKAIDLRGVDLSGASLNKLDLTGIDLRGAILKNAKMSGTTLKGSDLEEADLSGADLGHVNFHGANLHRANLEGAYLNGAHLIETNLDGAMLQRADLGEAKISHVNLRNSKMDGTTKIDPKWYKIWKLFNKKEQLSENSDKDFSGADLSNADLEEVVFEGADLTDVNFSNSNLTKANLRKTIMVNTNLQNAKLININFFDRALNKINYWIAKKNRNFMDTKVRGSDGADLGEATLEKANLQDAVVTPEQLKKTVIINSIILPDGIIYNSVPAKNSLPFRPANDREDHIDQTSKEK